jgi:hypothetical protein
VKEGWKEPNAAPAQEHKEEEKNPALAKPAEKKEEAKPAEEHKEKKEEPK